MKLAITFIVLLLYIAHMTLIIRATSFITSKLKSFSLPNEHAFYNMMALLVMPTALSLFRILQDVETRVIKFTHAVLHAIVCALMYYSLRKLEDPEWHYMHGYPAFLLYYSYFVQMALSLLIFVAIPAGDLREAISAIHSIIGIWLYHCYIGVAISGWHSCRKYYAGVYREETLPSGLEVVGCLRHLDYYKTLLIVGAVFINVLLLFPYFQWDEVGPL